MTTIKVQDMHCAHCVQRISELFDKEGISLAISLEKREIAVPEESAETAIELLDDLGFSGEIV